MIQFLIVTFSALTESVPLMMTFSITAPGVVMFIGPSVVRQRHASLYASSRRVRHAEEGRINDSQCRACFAPGDMGSPT